MNTIARGRPEVVVPLLKDLGYDGLGGAAGDLEMAAALKQAGLRFFNGYTGASFAAGQPALTDAMRRNLESLRGSDAALWLTIPTVTQDGRAFERSSPEADMIVVAQLRELADFAEPLGVRIALYPHAGTWLERVEDAIRVAEKVNRKSVGVTFNLCHWLKVEGSERDPLPVLRAAGERLMFVTINGADKGETRQMGWDRLIQPLDAGSYDVGAFLAKVRAAGFTGPIGFQGFGIRADPREVLDRTMAAWRKMQPSP
ncbi:MAG: sugar phosphate isomerase/epimerase [Chthoniobacter sp.]|nr:sugar phosphate isomerase/epimerase [Chthoniobacter sp.]